MLDPCFTIAHYIGVASFPLCHPSIDFCKEVLLCIRSLAIYDLVVVLIPVVASLAWKSAEVWHSISIIVWSCNLQLVNIHFKDSSLAIKQNAGKYLVYTPYLYSFIVCSRTFSSHVCYSKSKIDI